MNRLYRGLVFGLWLCVLCSVGLGPVRAQAPQGSAVITAVDTAAFPAMRVYMQVADSDGNRIPNLPARAFELSENASPVAGVSVSQPKVGVQLALALDPTDAFGARDVNGLTRLDYIKEAFADLNANYLTNDLDDVSVVSPRGVLIQHATAPTALVESMANYTSTFTGAADPFPLVNQALDLAAETPPRLGMQRYLIFFSNGLNGNVANALNDIATRATAAQVVLHTVYVGPAEGQNTTGAQNLRQLAAQGGGQFFVFTGPEALAPLWQTLAEAGQPYQLDYASRLTLTGQHTLAASITLTDGVVLTTTPAIFPLRVEAPRLQTELPAVITRTLPANGNSAEATPLVYEVPVAIDFPDGHPRVIDNVELYVNGASVVARSFPTQTQVALVWPLTPYADGSEVLVQVKAVDELGLAVETTPVTLTLRIAAASVETNPNTDPTETPEAPPNFGLLAIAVGGVLLMLGAVVGGVWWWRSAKVEPATKAEPTPPAPEPVAPAPTLSAPSAEPSAENTSPPIEATSAPNLTEVRPPAQAAAAAPPAPAPPAAKPTAPRLRLTLPTLRRDKAPTKPAPAPAPAVLEVVVPGRGALTRAPIELLTETIKLGRDPGQAQVVFPDRSVAALHARICLQDNVFRIFDEGSVAGTWVNFEPVPAGSGRALQHGDLINLGHVQLWFKKRDQSPAPVQTIKLS